MTWCVWLRLPNNPGWSCVVAGLDEAEAKRFAGASLFSAREMPEGKPPAED